MRYCIWNNKGGIGKTFLSFCLSVEYAIKHPNKNVVAVDMCPQANLSEMILGGDGTGENNQIVLNSNELTIPSYIKNRYLNSPWSKTGTETTYFMRAFEYNDKMPDNLYLLCGDMDLDLCSQLINELSTMRVQGAWKRSHSLLLDLIQSYEVSSKRESVFFIDCNPSFSSYTEMAILSSDRLIIPCTADFASIRGVGNVFKTIYGCKQPVLAETLFDFGDFSSTVKKEGMLLPKVHSFILNKSRTNDKKATKAYKAHADRIAEIAKEYEKDCAENFVDIKRENAVFNIKDGDNLVLVLNHDGVPLSKISSGSHIVYGRKTQVNQDQLDNLTCNINDVVSIL